MKKDLLTLGYEIPGFSNLDTNFTADLSLMDADIVVISPDIFSPSYNGWVSFSSGGGGCYDVSSSQNFQEKVNHFRKELLDMLKLGKTIFIFLSPKNTFQLAHSVSTPRKGQNTYSTFSYTNYEFLPISIKKLTSASGKKIKFTGNHIFTEFNKNFSENLSYEAYVENPESSQIIYTGKDNNKVLGAIYQEGSGHIITLPQLKYDENKFKVFNEEKGSEFWTKEAKEFGKRLVQNLIDIDQKLSTDLVKTSLPDWAMKKSFSTKEALSIENSIQINKQEIEKLKAKNIRLSEELINENDIKNLLFEQGIPLENSVTKALHILGYEAENYDDGVLELDQVIKSPEKHRFIGECEGKDSKDINITKFRQLLESLNADFAWDEVLEKAYGILFGNPQRLLDPALRKLDFTEKCKIGAKREKIALVKTADLFEIIKYLKENVNEEFKLKCREAIYNGLGKVVKFPKIPK